jgi:hypothetical protein
MELYSRRNDFSTSTMDNGNASTYGRSSTLLSGQASSSAKQSSNYINKSYVPATDIGMNTTREPLKQTTNNKKDYSA